MRAKSYNGLRKQEVPFSKISVAMVFFFPALGGFLFGYGSQSQKRSVHGALSHIPNPNYLVKV